MSAKVHAVHPQSWLPVLPHLPREKRGDVLATTDMERVTCLLCRRQPFSDGGRPCYSGPPRPVLWPPVYERETPHARLLRWVFKRCYCGASNDYHPDCPWQ